MSRKYIIITFLVGMFTVASSNAQGLKRKMADQYFKLMEYYRAAPIYDELAKTTVKKNVNDDQVIRRAAECFKSISDYGRSAFWYSKLVEISKATDEDQLSYIKVLLYNKNYEKAKEFMHLLGDKFNKYPIFDEYKKDLAIIQDLMKDSAEIKVTDAPVNSGWGEFSPAYYDGGIVYVTKKWSSGFVNRKYGWDGDNFVNLVYSKFDKDGKLSKSRKNFSGNFNSKFHNGP